MDALVELLPTLEDHACSLGRRLINHAVDIGLGADIDALGRLVKDEDLRLLPKPPRDDDLLLVATRELGHRELRLRRTDIEPFEPDGDIGLL